MNLVNINSPASSKNLLMRSLSCTVFIPDLFQLAATLCMHLLRIRPCRHRQAARWRQPTWLRVSGLAKAHKTKVITYLPSYQDVFVSPLYRYLLSQIAWMRTKSSTATGRRLSNCVWCTGTQNPNHPDHHCKQPRLVRQILVKLRLAVKTAKLKAYDRDMLISRRLQ